MRDFKREPEPQQKQQRDEKTASRRPASDTAVLRGSGGDPRPAMYRPAGEAGQQRNASARNVMAALAPNLDHPFEGVSIHADADGDAKAKAHGKPAVAEGSSIYLSQDVDPASNEGRQIIGHEMVHVVQQSGKPSQAAQRESKTEDFEREAHQLGSVIASGGHAAPQLRTQSPLAQGYDSPEHQSMGNDVHSVLAPGGQPLAQLGGVSHNEVFEQENNEHDGRGASQSPGLGKVDDVDPKAKVAVPKLAEMLAKDPIHDRARSLTISLRNFKLQQDAAGPYLAIESDPKTHEVVRYDVPVSAGDMTAMNGDLYGSVENMRRAPAFEVMHLQKLVDTEAAWEQTIINGADPDKEPDFDSAYESATSWRGQPVFAGGAELGGAGSATGGDTHDYDDLALKNNAHFGQDTGEKNNLELRVNKGDLNTLAQLARGPQGNDASGNEQAWMDGHARALLLARESFALNHGTSERTAAAADTYGHETAMPETGLVDPGAGNAQVAALPNSQANFAKPDPDKTHGTVPRSTGIITDKSKSNDAYVENAGADHFLTDAFAAGHQIVRSVIGDVTMRFMAAKGNKDGFLEYIVKVIQEGAMEDGTLAKGDLGTFQRMSKGSEKEKAQARGDDWTNHLQPGLKQQLKQFLDDDAIMGIGAKIVHDYYNKRGLIVHNRKGMTFMIKGDGTASEAPEARQIIAMAVLESRNQITDMINTGASANMQLVWDYTPDIDKTLFTQQSGPIVLEMMSANPGYMWRLLKEHFAIIETTQAAAKKKQQDKEDSQRVVEYNINSRGPKVNVGEPPLRSWLEKRHTYIQDVAKSNRAPGGVDTQTVDGVNIKDVHVPSDGPTLPRAS